MKTIGTFLAAIALLAMAPTVHAVVISSFEGSLEGWTSPSGATTTPTGSTPAGAITDGSNALQMDGSATTWTIDLELHSDNDVNLNAAINANDTMEIDFYIPPGTIDAGSTPRGWLNIAMVLIQDGVYMQYGGNLETDYTGEGSVRLTVDYSNEVNRSSAYSVVQVNVNPGYWDGSAVQPWQNSLGTYYLDRFAVGTIPEPTTGVLALGMAGLGLIGARRRHC